MKYLLILLIWFAGYSSCIGQQKYAAPIIPSPRTAVLSAAGKIRFTEIVYANKDPEVVKLLGVFMEEINQLSATKIVFRQSNETANFLVNINDSLAKDSYQLVVDDKIRLNAGSYQALSYATASLLQLAGLERGGLSFPRVEITDKPNLQYRALMIDLGRKWHDIETIKSIIKICRYYKIPYLQLHLSDDQLFTFKSDRYPELVSRNKHYTKDELRGLVSFADERGVTLIPELDLPGHSTVMRQTLPQIFGEADLSVINLADEKVTEAVKFLITEIAEVFESSPYFHIGADEADFSKFARLPQTQAVLKKKGYQSVNDLFLAYIVEINAHLKSLGKQTVIWEGFEGNGSASIKIPNDILVIAWETLYQRPESLLANGYKIVNASWKPLYLTPRQRWSPQYIYEVWNLGYWANWWKTAPSFQPIQLQSDSNIIGAQFCSWEMSDHMEIPELLARIPVFSEKLWTDRKVYTYEVFSNMNIALSEKLKKLLFPADMKILGLFPSLYPEIEYASGNFLNAVSIRVKKLRSDDFITYTLDGTVPSATSSRIESSLRFANHTDFKAAVFNSGNKMTGYCHHEFKKVDLSFEIKGNYHYPEDVNVADSLIVLIKNPVKLVIKSSGNRSNVEYRIKKTNKEVAYKNYDAKDILIVETCEIEARVKGHSVAVSLRIVRDEI